MGAGIITWVPNLISLARLLLVLPLVWLIGKGDLTWAFWLFLLAGASDGVDGFIARGFRARTKLGAWLDPVADKALVVGVFLALAQAGRIPLWLTFLVVLRDLVIVGGVGWLTLVLRERLAMQPLWISKANTFAQLAYVSLILSVYGPGLGFDFYLGPALWLATLTTVWSLVAYILRGLLILRTRDSWEGRET